MRDRESTNILSNGAVRYGIYDENGTLQRYEYIKLEDSPTVEGSIYNRANVLPDNVCDILDISNASEPKDAFVALRTFASKQKASTFEKYMMGGFV